MIMKDMKKRIVQYVLPVVLIVFFAFTVYHSGNKDKVLLEIVTEVLKNGHYENYALDDMISARSYKQYIESLDYGKKYFLKSDIDEFEKYKYLIDDEINQLNFEFFDKSVDLIVKRQNEVEDFYRDLLAEPFNFSKNETFETDPEKYDFPKNEKERKLRWRKLLKYQTLIKLNNLVERQENAIADKDTSYKVMPFDSLEAKARKQVAEDFKQIFRRLHQQTDKDRMNAYLNALVQSYDPHSEYMSPKEKKNFDIRMSGQFEGIGASLQELNNGYIKVVRIIPGSASWRQGELKAGDIILKVAEGDAEPISIVGMRLDNAVQYIRGKKGTEVRLTVKKPDNSIVVIPIIRDVVILEETYAKSAVLKDPETGFKAGYIYLPSFYVDFQNRNGRHCSKDVEIEIEKLKKEGVDGIILDLRNNGGGSLQDVVDMAGLFIDKGPIVQVKARYGEPYILKDSNPKLQYDGKLVIMVNKLSASASEIMAAAMQDYKRAVIVGSPATYGKGTVQKIVNLDQMLNRSYDDLKPLGNMRLTIQKFYRINGGATQLRGVKADIILPDIYADIDIGESELNNVIPWDEIQPAEYNVWKYPVTNLDKIKEESARRVSQNKDFNLVKSYALKMKEQQDETKLNLNFDKFRDYQKARKEEAKKYENIFKEPTSIKADILANDLKRLQNDSTKMSSFKQWTKDLEKDDYLEESVKILESMK